MGEMVTFNWPLHGQQLCKGIVDLLKENFETDFGLLVKDDKSHMLKVHHLVLAIFCPLLRNVTEKKLDLGNYTVEDLKRLVDFIYTGKATVNKAGLSSLRHGADTIGLKTLVNSIDSYVRRQNAAADDDDSQAPNHMSTALNHSSGTTADDTQSQDKRPKQALTTQAQTRKPASPIKIRLRPIAKSPVKSTKKTKLKTSRPTKTKLTCNHCSYSANHTFRILTHMAVIHHIDAEGNKVEKSVKCALCSFTCYSKDQLRGHRHLKHSKDQLKCDQCPYECGTRAGMRRHMKTHSDERPFMCEQCGRRFKLTGAYTAHLRRHKKIKTTCEVCGKTVALTSLKSHMELHKSDEKPFACHLCSFATRKRPTLKIHLARVHEVLMDKQGNVLGQDETSGNSKSSVHSSAEDNSGDCAVDSISNTD